jgi:WD40 repeat protein/ABC-type dipeptide/oligopeptide/nickel transport system ATPase subunit
MSNRTDIIAENNRDALRRLTRIVTRSQGFSLSIALCNYRVLQERVLEDLRSQLAENNLPETAIATLELKPDAKTLLAPIQELMKEVHQLPTEQKPKVLMVLGLDAVTEIEAVLKSANRVREEFANCLEFPMVLWLNDRTQDVLTREASDLANWTTAGAIEFQLEAMELKELVQDSIRAMFDRYLQSQGLGDWDASLQQFELITAIADLDAQAIEISDEISAGLDFAFGCMAMTEGGIEKAKVSFERSLAFWRQSGDQLKQAVCLLQLGLGDRSLAMRERYQKQPFYVTSQQYLAESIDILRNLQRGELMALYINFLTATWEELLAISPNGADGLESLVNEALSLHQIYPNLLRESHDRGILASVKLMQQDYRAAKESAESALALYAQGEALQLSNLAPSRRYGYAKYELWLARALEGLGDRQSAIARLEGVRDRWLREQHPYDAQIYVSVLEELRSLYTASGLYLEAFETKQHQRSVEQQYGLRAFIGAGTLNPKRERTNFDIYANVAQQSDKIAQEIEASGRMLDVEKLVDRIGQARYPLTVIHGDSGAGKSSILIGGLVPALRAKGTIDGRKVLVFAIKNYKDWSAEVKHKLQKYFGDRRPDLDPIQHFKRNIDENYLTVLIFDQFEDFFFKKEDFRDRLPFYKFLKACLHTDFVRVVLSLREDYLHYLLECDRAVDLEKVENDILGKQVRYYLGDFTQEQARQVIEALTRRSQLRLEPELIERLVTDLSGEQLRILPIELQVVGAQLESEVPPIANLREYLALTGDTHRKPSEVLVERWLENVVRDCGVGNKELAERVLYALTGNEEKRPQKTQAELSAELLGEVSGDGLGVRSPLPPLQSGALDSPDSLRVRSPLPPLQRGALDTLGSIDNLVPLSKGDAEGRGIEPLNEAENLSLVLAVLVGSGLAFRVSSSPDDRFQLIHDYLVSFIRKKYIFGMAEELRMTKEQLQLALADKERELQRAEIAEIEALSISCEAYWLANRGLEAVIAGVKAGRRIIDPDLRPIVPSYTEGKTFGRLWEVLYNIHEINRLEGHSGRVKSVAFAPDGKTIASSSDDNTIKLWNLEEKELRTFTGHSNGVSSVAFAPDGKTIASSSDDKTIKLWNLEGKELRTFTGHSNGVLSVAFAPDGKTIASGSADNTIKLWNLEGKELRTFTGHSNWIWSVAFAPDGKTIASGSNDNTIKLWNLEGKELRTLTGHSGRVKSVAFAPDGKTIASSSVDKTIKLWNLEGKELRTFTGHSNWVSSVAFATDGKTIASASDDKTIKLWNLEGKELRTFTGHSNWIWSVAFAPDGKTIASGSADNTIKLWNLEGKELRTFTGHSNGVLSVAFAPDGKTIASGSADNTIKLWNLEGKELWTFMGHSNWVSSVAFAPDGKTIASGSYDKTIKLWNLEGKELQTFTGHSNWVSSVAFAPDGKTIASGSYDKTIKLWNLEGKELRTFTGHDNGVLSVAFAPDGKTIASGSYDKTIKLWNLEGKELRTFTGHSNWVSSVAFAPDGKTIASGSSDNTIKLWNLEGKELRTFMGHSNWVLSVAFSPDGKTIASGSYDNSIKLWDIDPELAISEACDWLRPYLTNNPNVSESDRQLLEIKK